MRTPIPKNQEALAQALERAFVAKTKAGIVARLAGDSTDTEINGFAFIHGELHIHRKSDRTFIVLTAGDQLIEVDNKAEIVKP